MYFRFSEPDASGRGSQSVSELADPVAGFLV